MVARSRPAISPAQRRDQRLDLLARGLLDQGLASEAIEALAFLTENITVHEPSALPCLCAGCDFRGLQAEAGGERFVRDFVVSVRRSLHYWVPEVTARKGGLERLRRSMRVSLARHLNRRPPEAPELPFPPDVEAMLNQEPTDDEIAF